MQNNIPLSLVYHGAAMKQIWKGGAGGDSAIMLRIGDPGMYGKNESRWEQKGIFWSIPPESDAHEVK